MRIPGDKRQVISPMHFWNSNNHVVCPPVHLNAFETQKPHVLWRYLSTTFVAMDHHVVQLALQATVELALQQKGLLAVGPARGQPLFRVSM